MTGLEWGAALMAEPVRSAVVDAVFKSGAGFLKGWHHPLARQGMNSCFGNEEPVRFPLQYLAAHPLPFQIVPAGILKST